MNDIQKKTYIDKDETDSTEKKQMKKNKLCARTITRQARTTSSMQYYSPTILKPLKVRLLYRSRIVYTLDALPVAKPTTSKYNNNRKVLIYFSIFC